jgi:hypothetical protein
VALQAGCNAITAETVKLNRNSAAGRTGVHGRISGANAQRFVIGAF